jgi:adenylate kinase
MVRERSACLECGAEFIRDGFPRTLGQAECIKQWMDGEGLRLAAVVNHQLPAHGILTRLGGHRTCDQCKEIFHLSEPPRKTAGCCDRWEGRLFQKEDDRPESIEIRLKVYGQTTAPLIAFYQNLGLPVELAAIRDIPRRFARERFWS